MTKPTVPEVLPLVQALYSRDSAGCCWHVVLDDGNVKDASVRWTVEHQPTFGCTAPECVALGKVLPLMSTTQRRKLAALVGR